MFCHFFFLLLRTALPHMSAMALTSSLLSSWMTSTPLARRGWIWCWNSKWVFWSGVILLVICLKVLFDLIMQVLHVCRRSNVVVVSLDSVKSFRYNIQIHGIAVSLTVAESWTPQNHYRKISRECWLEVDRAARVLLVLHHKLHK